MSRKENHTPKPIPETQAQPFNDAVEAWFWFIIAQQAKNDGARVAAGLSAVARPCEPNDILCALNGLYKNRRLTMDHLMILRHYGRRQLPPDPRRPKEARAFTLWKEAFERIEPVLVRKNIVAQRTLPANKPNKFWSHGAIVYERQGALPL